MRAVHFLHISFVLLEINSFFSICLSQKRALEGTHLRTHARTHTPRSRESIGIDRVGKGALITRPRVQEKTAENRSLQLFRAAEHNRLHSEIRACTGGAPRHSGPLLCQRFTSSSSSFTQTHNESSVPPVAFRLCH